MKIKLRFKRDIGSHKKGDEKTYYPWGFNWQGMSEPERVDKGIFVECFGQGEFSVYRRQDVTPIFE